MPRSERRRWWIEPNKREKWVLRNSVTTMRQRICIEDYAGDRAVVALWRLVQWQRIRLERMNAQFENAQQWALEESHETDKVWDMLRSADSAVLSSRCSEEAMRVECEGYRNAELQEQVGDLSWQLAQAEQQPYTLEDEARLLEAREEAIRMRDELLRLRDVVCEEDAASIDRVIGEPAECQYPECEKCGERDHCDDCCHETKTTDDVPF